jgi:hypothetical protein
MATNHITPENLFTIRSSIYESLNTNHIITTGTASRIQNIITFDLRSSGILCGVVWYLFNDISGQRIGPIFKGQESEEKNIPKTTQIS